MTDRGMFAYEEAEETDLSHIADRDCDFGCFGSGYVTVQRAATGDVRAICRCTNSVHRVLTADIIARAKRIGGRS